MDLFEKFRRLAAADPRAARQLFVSLVDSGSPDLNPLLRSLSAPGEGRLRQLVANAVRTRKDRDKIATFLLLWHEQETDEFARAAIAAAVRDVDRGQLRHAQQPTQLPGLVDTYRYVSERLCHRVRNALPATATPLRRIESLAQTAPEPVRGELLEMASRLRDSLRMVSRVVEFADGDEYFRWKSVEIGAWLGDAIKRFVAAGESISLTLTGSTPREQFHIQASDFLLETIFWNLWKNAQQAVRGTCLMTAELRRERNRLVVTLSDNGPGFSEEIASIAFEERFSTKGEGRGRGLLEVVDAVQRLSGTVSLAKTLDRQPFVVISLPEDKK